MFKLYQSYQRNKVWINVDVPIQDVCTTALMGIHLGFIKFKFQLKSHIRTFPSLQYLNLRKFYKILAWKTLSQ